MTARDISIEQLINALQRNNRNDGAGRLNEGEEALLVRAEGRIKNLADVASIVAGNSHGIPILVSDIAEVKLGSLTRYGAVSRNGKGEAVEGLMLSLRGANAGQTVTDIEKKLEQISSSLPDGVRLEVFYNRGNLVNSALSSVTNALLQAIGLVMILLVLFLGNLRASLVVALVLPLAALITFYCYLLPLALSGRQFWFFRIFLWL